VETTRPGRKDYFPEQAQVFKLPGYSGFRRTKKKGRLFDRPFPLLLKK